MRGINTKLLGPKKAKRKEVKSSGFSCVFTTLFAKLGNTDLVCKSLAFFPSRFCILGKRSRTRDRYYTSLRHHSVTLRSIPNIETDSDVFFVLTILAVFGALIQASATYTLPTPQPCRTPLVARHRSPEYQSRNEQGGSGTATISKNAKIQKYQSIAEVKNILKIKPLFFCGNLKFRNRCFVSFT